MFGPEKIYYSRNSLNQLDNSWQIISWSFFRLWIWYGDGSTRAPIYQCKNCVIFWNHFKAEHEAMLKQAQDEPAIDEIYHFDFLEAKNLGWNIIVHFIRNIWIFLLANQRRIYFFGATNNGRKERAESYKQEFIKEMLRPTISFFHIEGMNNLDILLMKSTWKNRGIARDSGTVAGGSARSDFADIWIHVFSKETSDG